MASKHVVLQLMGAWAMATSLHAVIPNVEMTLFNGMIMIGTNGVRGMGVG